MRRAGRKDYNQQEIVDALRAVGVTVIVVNQEGVPDLFCEYKGRWTPIEVKRPRGRLTTQQAALRRVASYPVVYGVTEALAVFGLTA